MYVVGCTGGIGAGKSSVARLLASRGAVVLDADAYARKALEDGQAPTLAVLEAFGSAVRTEEGSIDRGRLASIVFADRSRLEDLEHIVHPFVREQLGAELAGYADSDALVVLDVALLVDRDGRRTYDLDALVVVDAPEPTCLERLVASRAMEPDAIRARQAAQASRPVRNRQADYLVLNIGTLAELDEMVSVLWTWITRRRAEIETG